MAGAGFSRQNARVALMWQCGGVRGPNLVRCVGAGTEAGGGCLPDRRLPAGSGPQCGSWRCVPGDRVPCGHHHTDAGQALPLGAGGGYLTACGGCSPCTAYLQHTCRPGCSHPSSANSSRAPTHMLCWGRGQLDRWLTLGLRSLPFMSAHALPSPACRLDPHEGQQAQEQGQQQAGGAASPFTKVFIDISGQVGGSTGPGHREGGYMTTYETAKQQEGAAPGTDAHDTPPSAAMLSGSGDETSSDDGTQRSGSASTAELAALLMSVRDRCERFRCCLSYQKEAQHAVNHLDPVDLVSDGGKAERLAAKRLRRMARKQDAQAALLSNLTISVGCHELTPCEM
ncbi:hypothetical protein HaLaN_03988 [Haematococcus lacustris]|uniref:Uncharacterized protein n=1 Tax=Haematococcus lacustris TaxID=44745 RepID=A0A699YHJ4_HAELA|nr:hypothetical protein HaLaN_03988 [Haematococcus lacustris]